MDATIMPKTPQALTAAIADAEHKLRSLRFQASANQLKQVREIRVLRSQIARFKTALTAHA